MDSDNVDIGAYAKGNDGIANVIPLASEEAKEVSRQMFLHRKDAITRPSEDRMNITVMNEAVTMYVYHHDEEYYDYYDEDDDTDDDDDDDEEEEEEFDWLDEEEDEWEELELVDPYLCYGHDDGEYLDFYL